MHTSYVPLRPQLQGAAVLLVKPLTQDVVLTALEKLKPGTALSLNGIFAEILMVFLDTLV